jgi:hypothetical protein
MKRSLFIAGSLAAAALPQFARAQTTLQEALRPAITAIPGNVGICTRTTLPSRSQAPRRSKC